MADQAVDYAALAEQARKAAAGPVDYTALAAQARGGERLYTVSPNEPGTFMGGYVKSLKDQFSDAVQRSMTTDEDGMLAPTVVSPGIKKAMTTPLAHPTGFDTIDGFTSPAGLLMLGTSAIGGLAESPAARRGLGKTLRFVGENADLTKPFKMAGKAGEWLERSAQEPPAAPPAPTGPHMDLSQPMRPGQMTQQQILERMRAVQQAGGTSIPPTAPKGVIGGRLQMAPEAQPVTVAPESQMQPPGVTATEGVKPPPPTLDPRAQAVRDQTASPMQQPRVQVGAEVVGRRNGLTKEAVRQQTGPLFTEAPGSASPVVPTNAFERMHDKLLNMGHGNPERNAYVQAAGDPKTAGQLEIMRRTLERNGLSVAAATSLAEAIRRRVMARLGGGSAEQ